MEKKGSWFSAIKRVFTHSSKEKVADGTEKKSSKEKKKKKKKKKKKGFGKLKQGDSRSFIPLFREPSSIEKILGEAEREHQVRNYRPATPPEQPKAPPPRTPTPPKVAASRRTSTPLRVASPAREAGEAAQPTPPRSTSPALRRVASPTRATTLVNVATPAWVPSPRFVRQHKPEPTLKEQHICAMKIQAAYRGYIARRSYRALRGLVRLQAVVKGQSVKRQTANALKCMQLLVRVQTQIQSRRIQMLENQEIQRQSLYKNDKDLESMFSKWNLDEWDDSTLTKEEIEARMHRKVDAIVKRERAMAYAYSHQLWKSTPRTDIRSGGFPFWWNWLEQRHVPPRTPTNPPQSPALQSFNFTPTRPSPLPGQSSNFGQQLGIGFDNLDTLTPRSTKSVIPPSRMMLAQTPPGGRPHQKLFSRGSATNSPFNNGPGSFRDDDSLTSSPPFSVPRYMSPTASAKAKVRGGGKEPFPDIPSTATDESKRRVSFPLGQEIFKWNKETTTSPKVLGKNQSLQSVGNLSVDSTVSMPATVGRKPFNRYV